MAFYCWGWRVRSIGCPDCEEAYLRVSLTGLSCHSWGMVAAPTVPEGDSTEIQSSPGTNLEGDPGVRHGHPGTLTCCCIQQAQLPEYFPHKPCEL